MPSKKEKPSTTSQTTKIFDVAKPGTNLTPSLKATARPVLVTNRPLMQDPMMLPKDETPAQPLAPTATKVVIKPLSDTDESSSGDRNDKKPVADKSDKKPIESSETSEPAETPEKSAPDDDEVITTPIEVKLADEPSTGFDPSKYNPSSTAKPAREAGDDTSGKSTDEPVPATIASEPAAGTSGSDNATSSDETPADVPPDTSDDADSDLGDAGADLVPDKTKLEKETADLEAAAKRAAEIDQLVDDKKYFLPINAVERRRSKRVILFGIIVSVLLLLLWVNMALDAGMIDIPGIEPLTDIV